MVKLNNYLLNFNYNIYIYIMLLLKCAMKYIFKSLKHKTYFDNQINSYISDIRLYKLGFQKSSLFSFKLGSVRVGAKLKRVYFNRGLFYK